MKTHFEIVEIEKATITVDVSMIESEAMHFNATEMAKQFEKLPADYLRLDTTDRYIHALVDRYGISHNDLVLKKRGGRYQGTWLHRKLALDFARWLSAAFAVALDEWVEQRLADERTRKVARFEAKTGYLPMSKAVVEAHDPVQFYHFSNEADMINKIVLGMTAKKFRKEHDVKSVRDALSVAQLSSIERLQRINTGLIEVGMDYDTRKAMLKDHYLNRARLAA